MTKEPSFRSDDWCPITGRLKDPQDFLPGNQTGRCLAVIAEARDLASCTGGYSETYLRTARTIFKSYDSVFEHKLASDYDDFEYKAFGAVRFVRGAHFGMYFDQDMPDFLIMAILAISQAARALRDLFRDGDPPQDVLVMQSVQDAQQLLALARLTRETELRERAMEQLTPCSMKPNTYVNERRNAPQQLAFTWVKSADYVEEKKSGQAGRAITKSYRREGWQIEEALLYEEHPGWGREQVAFEISQRLRTLPTELKRRWVRVHATEEEKQLLAGYPDKAEEARKLIATYPDDAFQSPVSWRWIVRYLKGPQKK